MVHRGQVTVVGCAHECYWFLFSTICFLVVLLALKECLVSAPRVDVSLLIAVSFSRLAIMGTLYSYLLFCVTYYVLNYMKQVSRQQVHNFRQNITDV